MPLNKNICHDLSYTQGGWVGARISAGEQGEARVCFVALENVFAIQQDAKESVSAYIPAETT